MKLNRILSNPLTLLLFIAVATFSAENLTRFDRQPGSKVKIDGSGNIHDWTVESRIIGGHLDIDPAFLSDPTKAMPGTKVPAQVEASVPVRSMKSGKSLMDNVMHDAMHEKEHPQIVYQLKELKVKETPKSANGPFQFDSVGDLAINGVTNSITMPVTIEKTDKTLKTTGSTQLKMTLFGIKPPAPKIALGAITTKDEVKITFEWLTAQAEK
jgi:hypothetical protein